MLNYVFGVHPFSLVITIERYGYKVVELVNKGMRCIQSRLVLLQKYTLSIFKIIASCSTF
jgi:hypothetical protein